MSIAINHTLIENFLSNFLSSTHIVDVNGYDENFFERYRDVFVYAFSIVADLFECSYSNMQKDFVKERIDNAITRNYPDAAIEIDVDSKFIYSLHFLGLASLNDSHISINYVQDYSSRHGHLDDDDDVDDYGVVPHSHDMTLKLKHIETIPTRPFLLARTNRLPQK